MTKRIIYPTDNGGVAIILPAPQARKQVLVSAAVYETVIVPATEQDPEKRTEKLVKDAVYRDETDEEFLAWVAAKDVPKGKPFKIIDTVDVPTDRTFRAAWEFIQ